MEERKRNRPGVNVGKLVVVIELLFCGGCGADEESS